MANSIQLTILSFRKKRDRSSERQAGANTEGFTLLEILMVIALLLFVYSVAMPRFSLMTGSEVASKLGRMASDVRNAYDLSVLSGRTYRIAIEMASGNYWLEVADREGVKIADRTLRNDPTQEEIDAQKSEFDSRFSRYQEQAEKRYLIDPETKEEIQVESPLIKAKDQLKPVEWTAVDSTEWSSRSLGPYLLVYEMEAEHHGEKQVLSDLGEKARGYIYFFPSGYVEQAVMHIGYKKEELVVDEEKKVYSIVTNPVIGTATVFASYEEIDVHEKKPNDG